MSQIINPKQINQNDPFQKIQLKRKQFQFKGEVPDVPDGENFQSTTLRRKTGTDLYTRDRETGGRFELSPGNYCIIPTAYYPDEEADFFLRVVTEKPAKSGSVCQIIYSLFF